MIRGQATILSSEALFYEGEQGSLSVRREHTLAANEVIEITEQEKNRAAEFLQFGIKPLDALHLASAEAGKADYSCACDDRLLRSAKKIKALSVKVVNPVDLVQEIEK